MDRFPNFDDDDINGAAVSDGPRRPGRPRKSQMQDDVIQTVTSSEIDAYLSAEEKIYEIIKEINQSGIIDCIVYLMKFNPLSGKWEQVNSYTGDAIPSTHDVGLTYGSGKYEYRFNLKAPGNKRDSKPKTVPFSLNISYDSLRREKERENRPETVNHSAQNDLMMMIIQMNKESSERMDRMIQAQNQTTMQMMTAIVSAMAGRQTNGMESALAQLLPALITGHNNRENSKYESELRMLEKGIELGKSQGGLGMESEENVTKMIVQGLIEKAPDILSFLTPRAAVRNEIRKTPGYDRIIHNPEQLKEIYRGVADKLGEEKAQKIAEKAGIQIPETAAVKSPEINGMKVMVT